MKNFLMNLVLLCPLSVFAQNDQPSCRIELKANSDGPVEVLTTPSTFIASADFSFSNSSQWFYEHNEENPLEIDGIKVNYYLSLFDVARIVSPADCRNPLPSGNLYSSIPSPVIIDSIKEKSIAAKTGTALVLTVLQDIGDQRTLTNEDIIKINIEPSFTSRNISLTDSFKIESGFTKISNSKNEINVTCEVSGAYLLNALK